MDFKGTQLSQQLTHSFNIIAMHASVASSIILLLMARGMDVKAVPLADYPGQEADSTSLLHQPQQQLEEQEAIQPEQQQQNLVDQEEGSKRPDIRPPIFPRPPIKEHSRRPVTSSSEGQTGGSANGAFITSSSSPSGQSIGIGNLVSLRRWGPWNDLGLDLLDGLIRVSVNRTPGNRNVAVRVGTHEINVG